MSDEAAAPAPATEKRPAGPKTSKALLGLLVLNLAITGFVAFTLMTAPPAGAAAMPGAAHPPEVTSEISGPVTTFDPFVVNLDEPTSRYLKVTLQLELASADVMHKFEKAKELVRDAILSHLSGLHVKDTLGAEAKDKLREDLLTRAEKLLGAHAVKRVFFQEFVVQ